MEYRYLGNTGIKVSRLCFGALTIGPLQAGLSQADGSSVIRAALDAGVTFIDTAELYQTYPYIRQAIAERKNAVVISSKSYAYTYEAMRDSVETACRELDRDYIDIFSLHEQTSRLTLKGHRPALEYLVEAKRRGLVRAIGVSTHTVEVVRAAALMDEIDVIHPILNQKGIGICGGTLDDMLSAIEFAAASGKSLYAMKALGGGHLSGNAREAFAWILEQSHISSVAVGMQSTAEVELNCAIFNNTPVPRHIEECVRKQKRHLLVEEWCVGCGACVRRCPMQALAVTDGKAAVDASRCVLCGYCASVCPEFCLKVI